MAKKFQRSFTVTFEVRQDLARSFRNAVRVLTHRLDIHHQCCLLTHLVVPATQIKAITGQVWPTLRSGRWHERRSKGCALENYVSAFESVMAIVHPLGA